ncbi:hypothetical protein M9H77_11367 [Catharanthus roseus]|uniref:Uncharacterized protein n=1 Tax=Catharanthus roseus TaxID=4058 RepID=A0ACC0BEK0_CATRO|nr:hypothetical protein M9H77_11367 [Catharanthus roseus]
MEYERIHKVQNGIISPSKLRIKLIGPHHQRKKEGSNSNSSRTSPARLEDSEFVKNSLLATQSGDFDEATNAEVSSTKFSESPISAPGQGDSTSCQPRELIRRENGDADHSKVHKIFTGEGPHSSSVHPVRAFDDENLDYDSTSSFEFHRGERSHHHAIARSFSRPMPSKWNDAEKWIMNRQNIPPGYSKKMHFQNQSNRGPAMNVVRVAPELANYENKLSVKRVDFCQSASQLGAEKFAFVPSGSHPISVQGNGRNQLIDSCPESRDLMEVEDEASSCSKSPTEGLPSVRSVSMRDMGTEMTPIPSQEPSRTATPVGATTPLRSPTSSIPSTPRRGEPAPTPVDNSTDDGPVYSTENGKKEMSEQEQKLKTRREIVALGVQLGKMNIAAWASKDDKGKNASLETASSDELEQIEFAKRAAAWEEAEISKHNARFKREEIKIQAWESQQKAKLEAEMRRTEAKVEQMRAQAEAKMVKKIAMAKQRCEEQRAAAEARRNQEAEKVAAQAEYIRQTGRLPSASLICCGW